MLGKIREGFFRVCYEGTLCLLSLIALPKLLYETVVHSKYRKSFPLRLGLSYPIIEKQGHCLIWIHAVSVGEVKAVAALAREIKASYPQVKIIVSTTTETGQQEARRSLSLADWHVYLPFDFSWVVRKIVRQAKPDFVILSETDLWYNFLDQAKKEGAYIAVVNGKISARSQARLKNFSFLTKRLYSLVDLFCVQNRLYKDRFSELGIPENKQIVTGNIKFDDDYPVLSPEEIASWKKRLGIASHQPVLTIGSTHDPEEKLFLTLLHSIWKEVPELKVLLVPRHPERFKEVSLLLEKQNVPFVRFSEISEKKGFEKVVLVDGMGLLRMCYQLADFAIVAGSYTPKVGGHNILEPSWYGIPVIFGPYMHTQLELVGLVEEYAAGWQLDSSQLQEKLLQLIKDPAMRSKVGKQGLRLIADLKGGTARTLQALYRYALKACCEKY